MFLISTLLPGVTSWPLLHSQLGQGDHSAPAVSDTQGDGYANSRRSFPATNLSRYLAVK